VTTKDRPVLSVALHPESPAAKVTFYQIFRATKLFRFCLSPDENSSLFNYGRQSWQLGLVNTDGFRVPFVKNAELKPEAFGAPEWARDGKSIFCHDLENIYTSIRWKRFEKNGSSEYSDCCEHEQR